MQGAITALAAERKRRGKALGTLWPTFGTFSERQSHEPTQRDDGGRGGGSAATAFRGPLAQLKCGCQLIWPGMRRDVCVGQTFYISLLLPPRRPAAVQRARRQCEWPRNILSEISHCDETVDSLPFVACYCSLRVRMSFCVRGREPEQRRAGRSEARRGKA